MINKFSKCQKCPAYFLLTDDRKQKIDKWEYKRNQYINKIKKVRLILLGESMPANRYFYDINTDYDNGGLRYTLKKEFNKLEISDSIFLESMKKKGVVLFDCALCPLYLLKDNVFRRRAATYCFLSINIKNIINNPGIPISTLFPENLGYLKSEIPQDILTRVIKKYSFSDQTGLNQLYEKIKETNP